MAMHPAFAPHGLARRRCRVPAALLLAVWLPALTAAAAHAQSRSTTHTVVIEAMRFSPASLEVRKGDTVTWRNKDAFPHTAVAQGKAFASPELQSGASWKVKVSKEGVFAYVCTLHPGMKAVLIVK
jgi:plastocyanin